MKRLLINNSTTSLNSNLTKPLIYDENQYQSIRFNVSQSTVAVGHFNFYPQDKTTNPLSQGKFKISGLRFSPFGESDFSFSTDNGINLARIQFNHSYYKSKSRYIVDFNRIKSLPWSHSQVKLIPQPEGCLPKMTITSTSQSNYIWVRNHPLIEDGLALIELSTPDIVIGVYSLMNHSVRNGTLEFFYDQQPISCEDMILFMMFLASSLATVSKSTSAPPSLSSYKSTPQASPTSPIKTSDLFFQKTHVW